MKKWFVNVSTDRGGTESNCIIEAKDIKDAENQAWELGLDNYNSYGFAEEDEEESEESGMEHIEGEHIETNVEEYNPEKHNDNLFITDEFYEKLVAKRSKNE